MYLILILWPSIRLLMTCSSLFVSWHVTNLPWNYIRHKTILPTLKILNCWIEYIFFSACLYYEGFLFFCTYFTSSFWPLFQLHGIYIICFQSKKISSRLFWTRYHESGSFYRLSATCFYLLCLSQTWISKYVWWSYITQITNLYQILICRYMRNK